VPALVGKVTLYEVGSMSCGLMMFSKEQSIYVLSPKGELTWVRIDIRTVKGLNNGQLGNYY